MVLQRAMQCSLSTPGGSSTEEGELHTPDRRRLDADPKHPPSTTRSLTMKIQSTPVHQYFFRILKRKYQESQVQLLVQVLFSVLPTRMMRSSQTICLNFPHTHTHSISQASWLSGRESACQRRRCRRRKFNPWVRKTPEGGNGNPPQYSCLGNPHGQQSLAGYSPQGRKELDTTEHLNTHA